MQNMSFLTVPFVFDTGICMEFTPGHPMDSRIDFTAFAILSVPVPFSSNRRILMIGE